jgi:predicted nuclease of predicted toxin-antitoxin system
VRALLDEMLTPAIARELRSRGHDVAAIAGHQDREALPDPDVLPLARAEHRAIVTSNLRDFRPLHQEAITPAAPGTLAWFSYPVTTASPETTLARSRPPLNRYFSATRARKTWPTAKPGYDANADTDAATTRTLGKIRNRRGLTARSRDH